MGGLEDLRSDPAVRPRRIARFGPSWFGLVMATGIVSVAAQAELDTAVSAALGIVAAAAWLGLLALTATRLVRDGASARDELTSPTGWPDGFAFVAATDVLGVRVAIAGREGLGAALWALGFLVWLLLVVTLPGAVRGRGRPAWWAASGNWLLGVVGTQSLAVLAGLLVAGGAPRALLAVGLGCWILGLALYVALAAVIGVRVRCAQSPASFTPDDWIVMGALAISTLAAAQLLATGELSGAAHALVAGAGAVSWAAASAAAVPLAALQVRAALRDRAARSYQVRWWAAVFPLGMYSAATHRLAEALGWPRLEPVARAAFWIAALAWIVTTTAATRSRSRAR